MAEQREAPGRLLPGAPDADVVVVDFTSAVCSSLRDLRARTALDRWSLVRVLGEDQVVLATVGELPPGVREPTSWRPPRGAHMVTERGAVVVADTSAGGDDGLAGEDDGEAMGATGRVARAWLSVPVVAPGGEVFGALRAAGARARGQELHEVVPTVQLAADLLGLLLAHELRIAEAVRRAERAEDAAHTDGLTELPNRRAWDSALAAEQARTDRYASATSVVALDVDALKELNDREGHAAGDELLRRTAAVLVQGLRGPDLAARLGGDEFGVLLPVTGAAAASDLVVRLRERVRASGVAVSVGVATRRAGEGLGQVWARADAAMYQDKVHRSAHRRAVPVGTGAGTGTLATPKAPAKTVSPLHSIDALLALVRDQLGMQVAFLNRFEGDQRRFRNLVSTIDLPVAAGVSTQRQDTYCQLIAAGTVPTVIPDAHALPELADLPVSGVLGIRAYIGVPVHRSDGRLYGTLCAFSQEPQAGLTERDAAVLQAVAGIVVDLAEREDHRGEEHHELLSAFDALTASGGPDIVYQPIVELAGLAVVGAEALSRFPAATWSPDRWFTDATAAGAGLDLELMAMANAVRGLGFLSGYLALNASAPTVCSPAFARLVDSLPLERVVLELTEHAAIDDYAALLGVLRPLRERGLRLAVDDAGAGFASMRHVLQLLPDMVKLDASLVRGIDADPAQQALTAALAAFAGKTGAELIAEGVETAEELECLRDLGVRYGQGYHLGRPAPLSPRPAGQGSSMLSDPG